MTLYQQIQEAVAYLHTRTGLAPKFGIILGTGLGTLAQHIEAEVTIPYTDIPHFPASTVEGHSGQLIFGRLQGIPVVAMSGRFHYYEGYSMKQVTFPVRVMKALGIRHLTISNAAGSTNADIRGGDMVFIRDHINLHPENPLRGENDERLGPRFPDMLRTYDREVNAHALKVAHTHGIRAHEGVYLGLQGPNLETPAEYVFAHRIGADVVGMSTVPEVIVARHAGLPVFVVSAVSNQSYPPEVIKEVSLEEVIATVRAMEPQLRLVVTEVIQWLDGRIV